jgi:hypothetical protein
MAMDKAFLEERARKASQARWAKEKVYQRLVRIADGFRAAHPEMTEAQAISRAVRENPHIYAEYCALASNAPALSHDELVAIYEEEVRDLCVLGGRPDLAAGFIDKQTSPHDVTKFFLTVAGERPVCK